MLQFALVAVAVLALRACAATYHVNNVTGDDANPGTWERPWKTLTHAGQVAEPGDEVVIGPGIYHEMLVIAGHPDATRPTVFRADPVGGAILQGEESGAAGQRRIERCRVVIRRPRVAIIGLDVRDTSEHAVEFAESPGGLADRCIFRNNQLDGVFFYRQDGGRVENCIAHDNGRYGIWFHMMQNGTAVSNTLWRNAQGGIGISDSPGVVVFNNLVAECGAGLRVTGTSSSALRSDHNLFGIGVVGFFADAHWKEATAGTLADWQDLSGQDHNSLQGPALLRDAAGGDFTPLGPPVATLSPAAREGLWVPALAGQEAPERDFRGRSPGDGIRRAVGALYAEVGGRGTPLVTLDMPFEGRLSVGIFDAAGQMVRNLLCVYPAHPGPCDIYWDGRDDQGKEVPAGSYQWRAVAHQIRGVDDGSVGESGVPPYGDTQVPTGINSIATDPDGNFYTTTFWDEAGFDVVKYDATGRTQWVARYYVRNVAGGYGQSLATDGRYLFVGLARNVREEAGRRFISDQVRRLDCATGQAADFPLPEDEPPSPSERNVIIVNPTKPDPWVPHQNLAAEPYRRMFAVRGLACDAVRLWVSNYYLSRVEAWDKETGAKLAQFPVDRPMGLTVAPNGTLWVCCGGDRVSEFTTDGRPTSREITGLVDPYEVTLGGPSGHLFVGDLGAGAVREYDLSADPPRLVRSFGRKATGPGRIEPDVFWDGPQGLAVDSAGRITLSDPGTARILRFGPDLQLLESRTSDFVTAPFVDERSPDVLLSNDRQYEVDYDTGAWTFTHTWSPARGIRRRLPNGRDYLFELGGHRMGVVVWAIEDNETRVRKCAMVGGRWMGNDDLEEGTQAVQYSWQDTSGDGKVQDEEMVWEKPLDGNGYYMIALGPGWWVDRDGDLWLCDQVSKSIMRFPLLGFDAHGSPRYDWAQARVVVPADTSPWAFIPTNVKTSPDGDLYVQGTVEGRRDMSWFWMGGTAVARYAPDGTRKWLRVLPSMTVSIAVDGTFWYTCEGHSARVIMYTDDGLMLCDMAPGRPSGYVSGWIDHALGLYAFRHPRLDRHYVYAEEDYYGKCIRYRITGVESLRRYAGPATVGAQ